MITGKWGVGDGESSGDWVQGDSSRGRRCVSRVSGGAAAKAFGECVRVGSRWSNLSDGLEPVLGGAVGEVANLAGAYDGW